MHSYLGELVTDGSRRQMILCQEFEVGAYVLERGVMRVDAKPSTKCQEYFDARLMVLDGSTSPG